MLAGLDVAELDQILSTARSQHYAAGTTVFEQGQIATHFYLLFHGRLRVTQVTPEGQQIIVRFVNPGELFGFAKVFRRLDYPGTAVAAIDSAALVWGQTHWDDMIVRYPFLVNDALHTLGRQIQDSHARIRELSTESVERRIAHALVRLIASAGRPADDGVRIDFPIKRGDIAELTGTTVPTVSRILASWAKQGLIDHGRMKITILDLRRLRALAGE